MDDLQLMTSGTVARCPDCRGDRLFVEVSDGEHGCTDCGAAVFGLDTRPARRTGSGREAVSRSA